MEEVCLSWLLLLLWNSFLRVDENFSVCFVMEALATRKHLAKMGRFSVAKMCWIRKSPGHFLTFSTKVFVDILWISFFVKYFFEKSSPLVYSTSAFWPDIQTFQTDIGWLQTFSKALREREKWTFFPSEMYNLSTSDAFSLLLAFRNDVDWWIF